MKASYGGVGRQGCASLCGGCSEKLRMNGSVEESELIQKVGEKKLN